MRASSWSWEWAPGSHHFPGVHSQLMLLGDVGPTCCLDSWQVQWAPFQVLHLSVDNIVMSENLPLPSSIWFILSV